MSDIRKSTAGQIVKAQLVAVADGEDVTTGTTTVYVTAATGSQAAGTGTVTHEGNGCWSYIPTQAETNYDAVSYTWVNTAAVTVTKDYFPITLSEYKATGFSTHDAAAVVSALGTGSGLTALATAANLAALNDFNPAVDAVANVTLVGTCTTNTDMRGTDGANTAAPLSAAGVRTAVGLLAANLDTQLSTIDGTADAIKGKTDLLPTDPADQSLIIAATNAITAAIAALQDVSVAEILTTQMAESYAADGTAPTLAQSLFLIQQALTEFAIAGTTVTVKKLDGATTAATMTLDDAAEPTSQTRAT